MICGQISQAEFYEREHKGIGLELCMRDNLATGVLQLLFNNERLFRQVEAMTGSYGGDVSGSKNVNAPTVAFSHSFRGREAGGDGTFSRGLL